MKKSTAILLIVILMLTNVDFSWAKSDLKSQPHTISTSETFQSASEFPVPQETIIHTPPEANVVELSTPPKLVTENVYETDSSVTGVTYGKKRTMSTFNTLNNPNNQIPDTNTLKAINNLNTSSIQTPFSINKGNESISPLSGDLTVSNDDLYLPGRNGLSFTLKRYYNSSSSNLYEKETIPTWTCACYVYFYANEYTQTQDINTGVITESNYATSSGLRYHNYETWPEAMRDMDSAILAAAYINSREGQIGFTGPWYQTGGSSYRTRQVFYIIGKQAEAVEGFIGFDNIFWKNVSRNKTYEEKKFPLGKGWTWDIPYIKYDPYGNSYLSLGSKGTYQIEKNTLKGYPWKDLTLDYDTRVIVNGERSTQVLKSIEGISWYFTSEGNLIQISDRYNNSINFTYIEHPDYGKVLNSITDALNNTITISYNGSEVVLQKGSERVQYKKQTYSAWNTSLPYDLLKTEILNQVVDQKGRTTTYNYETKESNFSLVSSTPSMSNKSYLLTSISYPTSGWTQFTYEDDPVNRKIGAYAVDQAYRIKERKDNSNTGVYNKQTFTYQSDMGSVYGQNIANFGATVSNTESTTVYDYRKIFSETTPSVFYGNSITTSADDERTTTTFKYDEARKITEPIETTQVTTKGSQSSSPVVTSKSFDDYGNIVTSTDALGSTTRYAYDDGLHLLKTVTQQTDPRQSLITEIDRNDKGTITEVRSKNQDGTLLSRTQYGGIDSFGNIGKLVISDDTKDTVYQNEYGYNNGFLTKQTVLVKNAKDVVETIETKADYDPQSGRMISYTDGRGNQTEYNYDVLGRLTRVVYPDDAAASVDYNDAVNQATLSDETGVSQVVKWDSIGQKIEEGIQDGTYRVTQKTGYDGLGRVKWIEDANAKQTVYNYDKFGRVIQVDYPNGGGTSKISYDAINRTQTKTDATNVQIRETYDAGGQIIGMEVNRGNGFEKASSSSYDYAGNVLTLTDSKSQTTTNSYDALGRLVGVLQPNGEKTTYKYSLAGNLTELQYPDGTKMRKTYDELGRLIYQTNASNQRDINYYDKAGNLVGSVDKKSQTFTYVFDSRNRITSKQSLDSTIGYSYDNAGRRTLMTDATGSTIYGYKKTTGELEKVTYPDGRSIQYRYNKLGLRSQMTDPFGKILDYSYDDMHRLSTVQSGSAIEASYKYYDNGLVEKIQHLNGNTSNFKYKGVNLDSLEHKKADGSLINAFSYSWDLNGNITQRTENRNGQTQSHDFTYDAVDRINTSSQYNELYAYDPRGNRQSLQSDRDLVNMEGTSYTYNAWNQLTQVKKDNGTTVAYKYNGDGLMVERTEGTRINKYYYDENQIIAEVSRVNGVDSAPVQYIRGNELIARQDSQGKSYYLLNGHGDVTELRDSTGNNSQNQYQYDIWGGLITSKETKSNPFLYSGEYWDSSAGLQYLRARWYDPSVGRFINEDTYEGKIINPLSLNLYTYVENNPLTRVDPSGHVFETLLDVASIGWSAYSLYKDPSWSNTGYLAWDVAAALVPFVPGSYVAKAGEIAVSAVKNEKKVVEAVTTVKNACHCFVAGTKVLTDEGEKNIEDIQVGDKVLSKDDVTGEVGYKEVTATFNHETNEIYKIQVGNQVIESTFNHPFWVDGKGWTFVKDLEVGDLLVQSDGNKLKIESIELEHEQTTVYNMTVDEFHTYFVSDLGIWVHNSNCFNWSSIKGTQPLITGTNVPKSFVMNGIKVNGHEVWVHGNATKHIGEFITAANKKGGGALSENEIMQSFMNAVQLASKQKLSQGENKLFVGGWEIGINGETGVIYHALMK